MTESNELGGAEYESRLQERLKILIQKFKDGKIKIAEGLQVIESIKAVRFRPDGLVDLDTVDGLVRAMALGVEQMHIREEAKGVATLSEIQTSYFAFIERHFGHMFKEMTKHGVTAHDIAANVSRNSQMVKEISSSLPEFISFVVSYWENTADIAQIHIEDMTGVLKGVYGGDLFPAHDKNIGSTCGIYTDTIILPDPFMRSRAAFERWAPEDQAYYFVKHGLNILQYKDLACADVDPPIVAVVPDYSVIEKDELEFIQKIGSEDVLIHSAKIFGREFDSFEELVSYADTFVTTDSLTDAIADGSRVLFETSWGGLNGQLTQALQDETVQLQGSMNPGTLVVSNAVGRLCASNELLIKAARLGGTPIIEVPTSWKYLNWKMEYDAERRSHDLNLTDLHVLKGLRGLADQEMEWLGNIPPDALIELRRTGALDEIRDTLSGGIGDLIQANPENYFRTTDQIFDNIHNSFSDHRKKIDELREKKWKFSGTDIGSWFVVGSLAITAAATGVPAWGIAAVVADQLLDAPKLKSIPGSIKSLANKSRELNRSPVGILYQHGSKKA